MSFQPVYVVDGTRTPFIKSRNTPGPFTASDLAVAAGRALLMRQPIAPTQLDEVILGCVIPGADEANIGRLAALRMGCGHKVPAWTVMRNCASGMQALDSAIANIQLGRSQLVLAGGTDALSRAPLQYSETMTRWFAALAMAKTLPDKLKIFAQFRLKHLQPVISLMRGLTDPVVNLIMGQTAENIAWKFAIDRAAQDVFAAESHRRVLAAQAAGFFDAEIVPLVGADGTIYSRDDGVRSDSTPENLAKLKPFFDRNDGSVTAGNSSQVTDGACWLLLASEAAVAEHGLKPIGRILDSQWAGLDPAQMGLGPVHAVTPILQRHGLSLNDVDAWEINEAFAVQVLGCLAAWNDETYCRTQLGLDAALGVLDQHKLNVDGGAIAQGHPVGASGARIVLHLLNVLRREGVAGKRGIATICIGGGLGGAMLVEAL